MSESPALRLAAWFEALEPREQLLVRYGAIAAAVLLLATVVLQLHRAVSRAEHRLAGKRADAAYIASVLPELRSIPLPQPAGQSLLLVVDRTARDAGLATSLRGTEPTGAGGGRVHLEGAAYDALVRWLLRIEREYGFSVQAASLEQAGTPGRVNATLTLVPS